MFETLATVKQVLGITGTESDVLLERLMAGAGEWITEYTGRNWHGGTFTEVHSAGQALLFLRNFPVESLISLKVDAQRQFGPYTERPVTSFVLHRERGVVESVDGPFLPPGEGAGGDWPGAVQVVYTTPEGTMPVAVREAFVQLVGYWYRLARTAQAQSHELLLSQQSGTELKTWSWTSATGLPRVPAGIRQLLQPFRCPPV
ncbi:MAG: phage head-tail connector protein [Gemmataceae bacterium]|nr:phage head-tail connector protein [Gemmataceae bacterium]